MSYGSRKYFRVFADPDPQHSTVVNSINIAYRFVNKKVFLFFFFPFPWIRIYKSIESGSNVESDP
jgi:hypothetical protein